MIQTNLSTRPFYNTKAVGFWLALLFIVALAATIANATAILNHSRNDSSLARQATEDSRRATELRSEAARLRASVDSQQVARVSEEARLANDLIDRRVFSWTELFNLFERTLPANVRITGVRPSVDRQGRILLTITVIARAVDDVEQFMEKLEETGAFRSLLSRQEEINDEDMLEASLEAFYMPAAPAAAEASAK